MDGVLRSIPFGEVCGEDGPMDASAHQANLLEPVKEAIDVVQGTS